MSANDERHQPDESPDRGIIRRDSASSMLSDVPMGDMAGLVGAGAPAPASQHLARRILRYKWTVIVVTVLLAGPSIAAVWTLMKPKYRAVGLIEVRPVVQRLIGGRDAIPFYEGFLHTQVATIRSPRVLLEVLFEVRVRQTSWYKQGHGERGQLARLKEILEVQPQGRTQVIGVSATTVEPRDADVIVNAVLDEYIRYVGEESDFKENTQLRRLVAKAKDLRLGPLGPNPGRRKTEEGIDHKEKRVAELQKQLGTGDPTALVVQQRMRLDETRAQLRSLNRSLELARWKQAETKGRLDEEPRDDAAPSETAAMQPRYEDDPGWQELNGLLKTARHMRDVQGEGLGPLNPRMKELNQAVAFAQKNLEDRQAFLARSWRLNPAGLLRGDSPRLALLRNLDEIETDIKQLIFEIDLMKRALAKQLEENAETFRIAALLEKEMTELAVQRELYDEVHRRLERERLESDTPGSIGILSRAVEPTVPSGDRRMILSAMALFVGLGAGVGLAFLRSGANPAVYEEDDLAHSTPVPFLGRLPLVAAGRKGPPLDDPLVSEGIRMVRTPLLQRIEKRGENVVLITSAGAGDGKTSVSLLLARSLAQCGKKVLLVDADLRNPNIALHLGLEAKTGLLDALARRVDESAVIVETDIARLSVVPAGQVNGSIDPELIANGVFSAALTRWRKDYDVVLLDSSPVLPVADARILASHADGTILVVRAERTPRTDVFEALSHLAASGGTLWGTLFIAAPRRGRYGYAYNYGYGASH